MKNRILYLVLIVSLAFNLAFLGMFIWHRMNPPRPKFAPEFEHMRKHVKNNMDDVKQLRDEFKLEKDKFMEYLRTDEFQESTADSLLNIMLEKQMKMERRFGSKLIEFKKKGVLPDLPPPPNEKEFGRDEKPGRREKPRERRRK